MKIELNLTNKWYFTFILVSVVLALGGGVIAYKSGQPAGVFGHSGEEIEVTINGQTKTLSEALSSISTSNVHYFDDSQAATLYRSTNCKDGTNEKWMDVTAPNQLPSNARKLIVKTYCGENVMSLRVKGSTEDIESEKTLACRSGDNAKDGLIAIVSIDSNKQFQTYNRGTNCGSRLASIILYGYIT